MKSDDKAGEPPHNPGLAAAVAGCRSSPDMMAELHRIYARADGDIAGIGASCMGGGSCCKFDIYGHRLYLTPAELAMLIAIPPPDPARAHHGRCPYQVGPRCMAYSHRPLGCRIFSCRAKEQKLEHLYEKYHRRIKTLHETHSLPYAYAELTSIFTQLFSNE